MSYIVGIVGVRATGKSTIARQLGLVIRADTLSSGRVREIIRAQYKAEPDNILFKSVTSAASGQEAIDALAQQSEILKPSFEAVIAQCRDRNANLIIEGSHVLPGIILIADLQVVLMVPRDKIAARLHKDKIRRITADAIERIMELQKWLVEEAERRGVPVIDTSSIPAALISL